MIKQATKTRKSQKQVFILRRYTVNKGIMAGCTCNVVRSTKTVKKHLVTNDYQVWQYSDGRVTCDCPAYKPCGHIDLVEIEGARRCDYIAPAKARKVAIHAAQVAAPEPTEVLQAVIETPEQVATVSFNARVEDYSKQCEEWEATRAERCAPKKTSSVEANLPGFLRNAMSGRSRSGQFAGRVVQEVA